MTTISRRRFLRHAATAAAWPLVAPVVGRVGPAFAMTEPDPATRDRNRLVVVFLAGGNDALNTVVPIGDAPGTERRGVYDAARPLLRLDPGSLLPLDRADDAELLLGLHPSLTNVHRLYRDERVAIVQGVGYEPENLSHFESTDIWQSGQIDTAPDSGWLGRHLDRSGIGAGEARGLAIASSLPLALRGRDRQGVTIPGLPFQFADGRGDTIDPRHAAFGGFRSHPADDVLQAFYGDQCGMTVDLVSSLQDVASPVAGMQVSALTAALTDARLLLEGDFGVECVFVTLTGFDTHAGQATLHADLLAQLDTAIATFFDGDAALGIAPMSDHLAARTALVTFSEFSRRVGENASGGTDHGDAVPLFVIGPAGRIGAGLHGEHPSLGTVSSPAFVLDRTVSLPSVYQSVLEQWLLDPDPAYPDALPGLFV